MSESSPADPTRRGGAAAPLLAACLSLASLWLYAAASTPRWLATGALPAAIVAMLLAFRARRRDEGVVADGALLLTVSVAATELAISALARS